MRMIKKVGKILIVTSFVMAIAVIALLSVDLSAYKTIEAGLLNEGYNYGEFTFLREMTLESGEKAYYYESGNEYSSYLHDNEGYVLLKDEKAGTLEYAKNEGGVPTESGISYKDRENAVSIRMRASDIDYTNEEVQESLKGLEGMSVVESRPVLASGNDQSKITNLVVFISFSGDNYQPSNEIVSTFNGSSTSLKSYYQVMSNNAITVNSQIPYKSNVVYVYEDEHTWSYYNTNSSNRWSRESTLVSNAIKSATTYFSLPAGTNLDINDDGYIDSVSIIVSGSPSKTWGSLLWPHSTNLDSIDGTNTSTVVNGKKVGNFSFNFEETLDLGVLCHETAHVLGAPDLYHYGTNGEQNQDIMTVGKWDLMEYNLEMPQYMLTYMRKNYIGGIGDKQIVDITENGVYSLAPVSNATSLNDVIAYKIPTSKDEYFMVEYRKVTNSGYDSQIPGSGLIIYRIKEPEDFQNSDGNMNAVYRGTGAKADEVFIFRPQIKMAHGQMQDERYNNSAHDLGYAYLSPNNRYFSKVGKEKTTSLYDFDTIYFSDGTNSDIIIEALSISETSIEFSINLGKDAVNDNYFDDKIALNSANIVNSTAFAGVSATLNFESINPQYLSSLSLELQDASGEIVAKNELKLGKFLDEYQLGTRLFKTDFVYADKGNDLDSGAFTRGAFLSDAKPTKVVLKITDADGDGKVLSEISVSDPGKVGWETVLSSKTELQAQVVASTKMTVGIRRDGTVDASGNTSEGQWAIEGYEGITSVALGYTHTLLLTKNLNVFAEGEDYYGETLVSNWYDVKEVVAGTYCSYGLKTDGTVLGVGLNDKGQINVSTWSGIKEISAMGKRVAGLTLTGTVVATGNFTQEEYLEISRVTGAKQIAVGLNFIAILKNDGSVQVIGTLSSKDLSNFNDVKSISAGVHHLLGIKESGEVVATGDNSYGQSMVSGLYDIVDIAGGEYHSAFLREDGVVEFRGSGSTKYGTNLGIGNLLYDNYIPVESISGITGVSGGVIRVAKGTSLPIGVTYAPIMATYARMVFSVRDIAVATINATDYQNATIYGVAVGETVATVQDNGTGISTTFTIVVYEEKALEGIKFSESAKSILKGERARLTLNYLPDGVNESLYFPTFTSSNDQIVSVSVDGEIEALGEIGEKATITAKVGAFETKVVVTIVGNVSAISVDLNGNSTLYRYGEDLDLSRYILKVQVGSNVENSALTPDMISGYDKYDKNSIKQTITVTYMGVSTTFEVSVKDYVTGIEKVANPTKKYLYNYDLDAVSGGYKVYYASGAVEGPNAFVAERFYGYDKTKVGVQIVTYVHNDSVWGTEFTIEEEISVVDYAQSISFQPVKTTYLYSQGLDFSEFVDVNMMSGAVRQMELAEFEVKDAHTPITDEKSPLYSLYSLRVGPHVVTVSYVDPETQERKTTTATVNVDIAGEYRADGRDEDTLYYYYEIGGKLYVGLSLVQKNTLDVVITDDSTKGIYYQVYTLAQEEKPFDNTIVGAQDSLIKIFVSRQNLNGNDISVANVEVWSLSIASYGLAKTKSLSIVTGAKTNYLYGEIINGNAQDVMLEIVLEDGTHSVVEPMELVYDSEYIGEQILKVRYLDNWLELPITISDYVVALERVEDIEIIWNGEISFEVYGIYARAGRKLLEEGSYALSAYTNQKVGEQKVVVTYLANEEITTEFKVIIIDQFYNITIKDQPNTVYAMGDKFDPTSTYTVTMISGATKVIPYDTVNFYYTPELNSSNDKIGEYQVISIFYQGEGVTNPKQVWRGSCIIPNYVTKLEVVLGNSKTEYKYGESLSVVLRASYADGTVTTINDKSTYSTNYNDKVIGKQNVTIYFVYSGVTYTTSLEVNVSDTVADLAIGSIPNLVSYGYGDVINWTGAKVIVTYSAAGKVNYLGDDIKKLNVTYTTLIAGTQKVTIESGGKSAFFNVMVSKQSLACQEKNTENVEVSIQKKQIAVKESTTINAILNAVKVSPYLYAKYRSVKNGDIDVLSSGDKKVATGDKLIFVNKDGVEVFLFTVYLNGDTNGDGQVNSLDLSGMAGMLADGTASSAVMDYNGDGKANLTDLVGYARKTGGGAPKNVPTSDVASEFVAPVRFKGKEEENA